MDTINSDDTMLLVHTIYQHKPAQLTIGLTCLWRLYYTVCHCHSEQI